MRKLIIVFAAAALGGCAMYPSPVDSNFGSAVMKAKAAQTADPGAAAKTRAAASYDGTAAIASMDRYRKSYETPPPPVNVFNIGIGSSAGSSSH